MQTAHRRKLHGVVTSRAGDRTIVVRVLRTRVHSKYKTRFEVSKKYHVHDPENAHTVGDEITFEECRPLSKTKRWRTVKAPSL